MTDPITLDVFQKALPKHNRHALTQAMVDTINDVMQDPLIAETYRDNLLGYTKVMKDGRFKMSSYINAARYVSHKMLGSTDMEAYAKTFPSRYQDLLDADLDQRKIVGYVSAYNSSKLVMLIFEQTIIPSHVLFKDIYSQAVQAQAYLMIHATSDKVKSDAANSIMVHLRPPEVSKIELDVNIKEDQSIADMRSTLLELSAIQKKHIEMGIQSPKQIAHSKVIVTDAELVEEDSNEQILEPDM